jgi:hypothetical protein
LSGGAADNPAAANSRAAAPAADLAAVDRGANPAAGPAAVDRAVTDPAAANPAAGPAAVDRAVTDPAAANPAAGPAAVDRAATNRAATNPAVSGPVAVDVVADRGAGRAAAEPAAARAAADPAAANLARSASVSGKPTLDPGTSTISGTANHPTPDLDYSDPDGLDYRGARADALLGLAADNLALGRIAAARRLAARAAAGDGRWRATVRAGWVGAEIELAAGRPAEAVAPARRAAETARERGARRHVVKSDIVLGVALSAAGDAGDREAALKLVESALAEAEKCELHSLIWVAARVAADLGAQHAEKYRFRGQEVLHAVLRRVDPCVMRIAHDSPWVPTGSG